MTRSRPEILCRVADLEAGGLGGVGLGAIRAPTLVLEVRADANADNTLGIEIAARIPRARHRVVAGGSRWPWGEAGSEDQLLEATSALPPHPPAATATEQLTTDRILATVLFTDIVGSTERLAELGDTAWRQVLERHHGVVRAQLAAFGGREVDNAGDGFLAAFEAPARGVRCAMAIRDEVRTVGLSIRCGLHTGECERIDGKLVGIAVHIGARIASQATRDEILVSGTVRDLVAGSGITFTSRGTASLKGLPGEWPLFAVAGAAAPG